MDRGNAAAQHAFITTGAQGRLPGSYAVIEGVDDITGSGTGNIGRNDVGPVHHDQDLTALAGKDLFGKILRDENSRIRLLFSHHLSCFFLIGYDTDHRKTVRIRKMFRKGTAVRRMGFIADDRRNIFDDTGIIQDAKENQIGCCCAKQKNSTPGIVDKGICKLPANALQQAHSVVSPFSRRNTWRIRFTVPYRRRTINTPKASSRHRPPMSSICRHWLYRAGA